MYPEDVSYEVRVALPIVIYIVFVGGGLLLSYGMLEKNENFNWVFKPNGYYAIREDINSWNDKNWDRESFFSFNVSQLGCFMGYQLKYIVSTVLIFVFCNNVGTRFVIPYEGYPQKWLFMG